MNKQITLSLGGSERTIDVGKFWFTKFYGEVTGNDPLNSTDIVLKPEKQFDFVVAIVFAGLRTQYRVDKKPEDFTYEDVQNWIGLLEDSDVSEVISKYSATVKTKEPGEAETQAVNA